MAKDARKKRTHHQYPVNEGIEKQQNSIEAAISLLEKMKMDYGMKHSEEEKTQKKDVVQLEQENNDLKEKKLLDTRVRGRKWKNFGIGCTEILN